MLHQGFDIENSNKLFIKKNLIAFLLLIKINVIILLYNNFFVIFIRYWYKTSKISIKYFSILHFAILKIIMDTLSLLNLLIYLYSFECFFPQSVLVRHVFLLLIKLGCTLLWNFQLRDFPFITFHLRVCPSNSLLMALGTLQ